MKKSRIIVPAMAVIAFSTAASIAGSVAWFTASRQVTINGGSYAVVKTNSNLEVTLAAGVGTSLGSGENQIVFNGKLTDASFNHNTPTGETDDHGQTFYEPNEAGTAIGDSYTLTDPQLATKLVRATLTGDVTVYSAATFNITFTMKFGAASATRKDVGLFLNNTASQSAFTVDGGAAAKTATGFRMAFVPTSVQSGSSAKPKVFADLQTSGNCKYVAGPSNFNGTSYSAGDLIDSAYNTALPTSETTREAALARNDYLATFTAAEGSVNITFTVVCWFEGTDPNIEDQPNATDYQTVVSKLVFDAVDLNAAA